MTISRRWVGVLVAGTLLASVVPARADTCRVTAIDTARPDRAIAANRAGFAMSLLIAVAGEGRTDTTVSPSGAAAVLAQLALGADRTMSEAIGRTLRLKRPRAGLEAIRRTTRELSVIGSKPGAPFSSADALFVDDKVPLKPGIAERAEAETGAPVQMLDFTKPAAVEIVDKWASDRTRGRIRTILEPGEAPGLVAIDAFHFKDCWRHPFDAGDTAARPFERLDRTKVERPTMRLDALDLAHGARGRFRAVELPYADGRFAMVVVTTVDAPAAPRDFAEASGLLTGTGLKGGPVRLSLPKFSGTGSRDLLEVLGRLGLAPGLASASGLSGFAEGLKLGAVRQKTFVEVNEEGTEAAAVTAGMATRGVGEPPTNLTFDRPFVFALRHRASGTILLTGYVADPGEGK